MTGPVDGGGGGGGLLVASSWMSWMTASADGGGEASLALRTSWLDFKQDGVHPAGKLPAPPFPVVDVVDIDADAVAAVPTTPRDYTKQQHTRKKKS